MLFDNEVLEFMQSRKLQPFTEIWEIRDRE